MLRRPLAACALLLAVYVGISFLNDPRAYLGTDTGGKVATLKVMTERGRLDPDIGYWAERWDPDGLVHPLYYTSHVGRRWVNATTLPMLYAAYPLYDLGGYRLVLLLPMLGSLLAALAARALARRLSDGDGWAAFWIVGAASPLTIYALDFWEHSLGVAVIAWAVVLLLDAIEERRGWAAFLGAGGLFGVAATMRTEALVYAFVAVGGACLVLLWRERRLLRTIARGTLAVAGLIMPLAVNYVLEVVTVGDPIRFHRASGTAATAVATAGDVAGSRIEEALLNAVGLINSTEPKSVVVGLFLAALLAFVCARTSRTGDAGPAMLAAAGIGVLYIIRFVDGFSFIPGLIATTPLAVVGLVLGWRSLASRYVLGVGLAALPLVWATQFQGGAGPQWAGRYLLASGLLFGVAGVVALEHLPPWVRTCAIGLACTVTAFGLTWTSIRTHSFADASAALSRRPEPVLVSRIAHLAREGGAFYLDRRWLTVASEEEQAIAMDVLERAGITRFALVEAAEATEKRIPSWTTVGSDRLTLVYGITLRITTYQAG